MKQTPLTNMENRWVHSTKEAFDALVAMGYKIHPNIDSFDDLHNELIIEKQYIDSFILEGAAERVGLKQAYYHNGHFYDEPYEENKENKMSQIEKEFLAEECGVDESRVYNSFPEEEFTITEEKVPFPELEDIESVNVKVPKFIANALDGVLLQSTHSFKFKMYNKYEKAQYDKYKELYENSKDFKVTWKLKEKINRNLHENRALALAIGRYAEEKGEPVHAGDDIWVLTTMKNGTMLGYMSCETEQISIIRKATLPDDYIIQDQVLQWMKEYQEQGK